MKLRSCRQELYEKDRVVCTGLVGAELEVRVLESRGYILCQWPMVEGKKDIFSCEVQDVIGDRQIDIGPNRGFEYAFGAGQRVTLDVPRGTNLEVYGPWSTITIGNVYGSLLVASNFASVRCGCLTTLVLLGTGIQADVRSAEAVSIKRVKGWWSNSLIVRSLPNDVGPFVYPPILQFQTSPSLN